MIEASPTTTEAIELVVGEVADMLGSLLLLFPIAFPMGLMIGTVAYLFHTGYSGREDWFQIGLRSVTDWRKDKMLTKINRGKVAVQKVLTDGEFLKGEADFDYSTATIADLVCVIEADYRSLTADLSVYDSYNYNFYSATAPHPVLLDRLKKVAEMTDPLKPAAAKAVRSGLNDYHVWAEKNREAWHEYQRVIGQDRTNVGEFLEDAVSISTFMPRGLKLEQNERQVLKSLNKALKIEISGVDSGVSYSDLLKGKVA